MRPRFNAKFLRWHRDPPLLSLKNKNVLPLRELLLGLNSWSHPSFHYLGRRKCHLSKSSVGTCHLQNIYLSIIGFWNRTLNLPKYIQIFFSKLHIWSLTFWNCVKIVLTVKWWMENADMANDQIKILFFMPPGLPHKLPHGN